MTTQSYRARHHHGCDCRKELNAKDVNEDIPGRTVARWSMRSRSQGCNGRQDQWGNSGKLERNIQIDGTLGGLRFPKGSRIRSRTRMYGAVWTRSDRLTESDRAGICVRCWVVFHIHGTHVSHVFMRHVFVGLGRCNLHLTRNHSRTEMRAERSEQKAASLAKKQC